MVSALASVRAAAVVAALSAAFGGAVAALVVAGPDEATVVVAFELPLLSPPQAASRAASDNAPPPASNERRVNPPPKPNVPGSMGGIVSSWWNSVGESGVSMDVHPPGCVVVVARGQTPAQHLPSGLVSTRRALRGRGGRARGSASGHCRHPPLSPDRVGRLAAPVPRPRPPAAQAGSFPIPARAARTVPATSRGSSSIGTWPTPSRTTKRACGRRWRAVAPLVASGVMRSAAAQANVTGH